MPIPVSSRVIGLALVSLFPALAIVLGARMLPFLMMPLVFLGPSLLGWDGGRPDGGPDSDDGPGGEPRRPVDRPPSPRGGVPLPDAQPARVRLRDQHRPRLVTPHERRHAREPGRRPAPTRPRRR